MQHAQYNFIRWLTVAGLLVTAESALAGRIVQPAKPDPILDGGDPHPCLAGPDLAFGMDVTGQPVAPADVGAAPVPLPDQLLVPLHGERRFRAGRSGNGPYMALDGRRLEPLLDPGPCPR